MIGNKDSLLPEKAGSVQPAGPLHWAEVLAWFAGGGCLTASSVCLCLGSANCLCA